MARINKYYREQLGTAVLLGAIGTVAIHRQCEISEVRRMTFAEFNVALDAALGQTKLPMKPGRLRKKAATVNERMAAMMQAAPYTVIDWPASTWAEKLGVTAAAVKQTTAWANVIKARLMMKVDRAERGQKLTARPSLLTDKDVS